MDTWRGAQRTHKEEFYAYYDGALDLGSLNKEMVDLPSVFMLH